MGAAELNHVSPTTELKEQDSGKGNHPVRCSSPALLVVNLTAPDRRVPSIDFVELDSFCINACPVSLRADAVVWGKIVEPVLAACLDVALRSQMLH